MRALLVVLLIAFAGCAAPANAPAQASSVAHADEPAPIDVPVRLGEQVVHPVGTTLHRDLDITITWTGWFEMDGEREELDPETETSSIEVSLTKVRASPHVWLLEGLDQPALVAERDDKASLVLDYLGYSCDVFCTKPTGVAFEETVDGTWLDYPLTPGAMWDGRLIGEASGTYNMTVGQWLGDTLHVDYVAAIDSVDIGEEFPPEVDVTVTGTNDGTMRYMDGEGTNQFTNTVRIALLAEDPEEDIRMLVVNEIESVETTTSTEHEAMDPWTDQDVLDFFIANHPDNWYVDNSYPITIESDAPHANAANPEPVTFWLDGDIPEGHTTAWTDGYFTKESPTLELTFAEPGRFPIGAQTSSDGEAMAADGIEFPVHFQGLFPGSCAIAGGTVECDQVLVPVREGIESLSIDVETGGILTEGTLQITAPNGEMFEGPLYLTEDIMLGDWRVRFVTSISIMGEVTYEIDALHGEISRPIPASQGGNDSTQPRPAEMVADAAARADSLLATLAGR